LDPEEILSQRGVAVDHVAFNLRATGSSTSITETVHCRRLPGDRSCRMDEIDIRVKRERFCFRRDADTAGIGTVNRMLKGTMITVLPPRRGTCPAR
jgi:transposase-like protein